jgi:hypothetical protein
MEIAQNFGEGKFGKSVGVVGKLTRAYKEDK